MKNKILGIVSTACFAVIGSHVSAQTSQAPHSGTIGATAPSSATAPGATPGGMNGISSASNFDGSTNVNVPIHSFSLDNQDYSISLGYNTRGVKIDETVSPAGLHWNIYAEGSITRVVKDLPDELNKETMQYFEYSDINNNQTLYPNHKRFLKGKMVGYFESGGPILDYTYRDTESDDFIFSCGGKSFTFNLGPDAQVFTHPHNNIKVTPLIDGVPIFLVGGQTAGNWGSSATSGILEFLIRDEQGTQYLFSRGDYQYNTLYNNEYGSDEIGNTFTTSRWVIKKVTFANGNEINYTYAPTFLAHNAPYYQQNYSRETWSGGLPTAAEFLGSQMANSEESYSNRLLGISYPNGTNAEFIYSDVNKTEMDQKMLDEIKISSGSQCMHYKLNQSKVNNRWFLNSVKIASCDNTTEEPYYSFEYNPLALPERFNTAQDFYGYYNGDPSGLALGSSTNNITIPRHDNANGTWTYGNERQPNANYAIAGNLMKVKNAFGGEVSFRYSGNFCANPFYNSTVALPGTTSYFIGDYYASDGLKVDSVIEKEIYHPADAKITVYEYSGGQSFIPGGYFHYPDEIDSATNQWRKVIFQSMFLTAHQFIGGANHGYSLVTEKNLSAAGELLGKRTTVFSNMRDEYSNGQLNYYKIGKHYFEYPYTDKQYLKDWAIGLPMKTSEYDQNNHIVKQTERFYDINTDDAAAAYITNTRKVEVNSGTEILIGYNYNNSGSNVYTHYYPNKKVFTDTYYPFTGTALLRCSKVKSYVSDTRFVVDSVLYTYDSRNNLKTTTTLNSKGERVNTVMVYNYEVGGPGVLGGDNATTDLYRMTDAGLEKIVSMERWKLPAGSPSLNDIYNQKLLTSYINTFTYTGGTLRAKAVYDLKVAVPLSYTTYTGMSMGSPILNPYSKVAQAFAGAAMPDYFEKSTEIKLADAKGNPLETQISDMNLYKSMIWDTINGKKLAEVASAQYADIAYSGFETSVKGNLVYDQYKIVPASTTPYGGISGNYVLKIDNTSIPPKHPGLTAGKEYIVSFWSTGTFVPSFAGGGLGNIPLTQVSNVNNNWYLYTARFTPIDNTQLNIVINSASPVFFVDDFRIYPSTATMQTYNYTPLFGINSAADANGRITYYEYDKLGRQTIVRDQKGNIISKTKIYNGGGL